MKFANVIMKRNGRCTIGDDIQLLAIENLYKYMGIDYEEVIRIPFSELSTYDGEYVVLPLSFPFYGYSNGTNVTNFSRKIIPVFLGFASMLQNYNDVDIAYLKNFEPIGCRDQYTMEALRKNNILSYLNGCLTITLPKRRTGYDGKKKIFCVDLTEDIIELIPNDLQKDCVFTNHVYFANECVQGTEQKAREVYETYVNEARMIITTRMHAALPCLAAGIPVILIKDKLSIRFPMIQSLIPVYTKETYGQINWNPFAVECEELKESVLRASAERIMSTYNKYKDIYEISKFYECKNQENTYVDNFTDTIFYLQNNFTQDDEFTYALWGITPTATLVYEYIKTNYKNAKLTVVIDQNKTIKFCGIMSEKKEKMLGKKETYCFVCAGAAMPEAKEFFKKINHDLVYYCWSDGLIR